MEYKLDLRGYNSPIPILKTREALKKADIIAVVVDGQRDGRLAAVVKRQEWEAAPGGLEGIFVEAVR